MGSNQSAAIIQWCCQQLPGTQRVKPSLLTRGELASESREVPLCLVISLLPLPASLLETYWYVAQHVNQTNVSNTAKKVPLSGARVDLICL